MTLLDLVSTECTLAKGRPFLFEVQPDSSVIGWRCFPGYVLEASKVKEQEANLYMECTDSKAWRAGYLAFSINQKEDTIASGKIKAKISFIAVLGFSFVDDNLHISYINLAQPTSTIKEPYSNKDRTIVYCNQIAGDNANITLSTYEFEGLLLICQKKSPDIYQGKLPMFDCLSVPHPNRFEDSKSTNKRKRVSKIKKKTIPNHPRRNNPVKVLYAVEGCRTSIPWKSFCLVDTLEQSSDGFCNLVAMEPNTFGQMKIELEKNGKEFLVSSYQNHIEKLVATEKAVSIILYDMSLESREGSFVVTIIQKENHDEKEEILKDNLYMKKIEKDMMDYDMEFPVVFRGYPWSFKPWLNKGHLQLLQKTFSSKGLSRNCTSHMGLFEMVGNRQTKQASSSMITTIGASNNHDYYRADMDRGTLPFVKSIVNGLTEEAVQCCYESGEFLQNSLTAKEGRDRRSICPYSILTLREFSNCNHQDSDYLDLLDTEFVLDCASKSEDTEVKDYIDKLIELMISKGKKERIPLLTTCAWSTIADESNCSWILHQKFAMPDIHVAFNIGSKALRKVAQAGATFQGTIISHLTSRAIWTRGDLMRFTPPKIENYTIAWGSSGGSPESRGVIPVHRPVNNTLLQNWLRRNPGRQPRQQNGRGRGGRGRGGRGRGGRGRGRGRGRGEGRGGRRRGTGGIGPGPRALRRR